MIGCQTDTILMTGATGVLGRDLLTQLLKKSKAHMVIVVRTKDGISPEHRIQSLLNTTEFNDRLTIIEGDITQSQLGLDEDQIAYLLNSCTHFLHIAATTDLAASEKTCLTINVGGTSMATKLAWRLYQQGSLKQFVYFSTAFAAGSLTNICATENDLPHEPVFANHYESSKYKAEKKVRHMMGQGLPAIIIRPSIVVGHSKTGEVSDFNVIYPFMKLFIQGLIPLIPSSLDTTVNIVPIDYVIDMTFAIMSNEHCINKTFNLVSKTPMPLSLLKKLRDERYPNAPEIRLVGAKDLSMHSLSAIEQQSISTLAPYIGYFNGQLTFDSTNVDQLREKHDITQPSTDYPFLKILIQYAIDANYLVL